MAEWRAGRTEEREGFVVAYLEGEPYGLGLQHGTLLRDRIRLMRGRLFDDLIFRQGRLIGVAFVALCRLITLLMERHIPTELKHEMRGVADGSGISYRDVLLLNCFDDLLHSLVRLALSVPAPLRARLGLACSCLARVDPNAGLLLARNLDYYLEGGVLGADGIVTRTMKEQLTCFVVRPTAGRAHVSIGWPGFVGVVTGMNAAGLALSCLTSPLPGATPNATPLPLLYRRLLERAENLAEVEQGLRAAKRTIGNNLVAVSARDRDGALFEFTPKHLIRIAPRDGLLVTTNHFQQPDLATAQGGWIIPNSLHRLQRLTELVAAAQGSELAAERVLLDTTPPPAADVEAFSCLMNPGTIYGAVLLPDRLRLRLLACDRAGRDFVELDVAELLGLEQPVAVRGPFARRAALY